MTGRTQVPDSWLVARLGDVADWVNGLAFRDIQFSEIGKPIIRIAELKAGITTETKFTNQCFDQSVHIRQGDLLFAWSGQPETSINSFWWNGPEGWLNQHIFRVTTRPQVNTTFFYYLLRHLNSVFVRIARGKQTAGLGHVTKEELFKMVAAFPPMWEQKAIAAALGGVDEAIERTEEVIAATERLRDALLHELLTRGVPGQHSEWKEAPGIGTIPACWDVVSLGDVCRPPEYGAAAPARPFDASLPRYVRITDITDDGRLKSDDLHSAESSQVAGFELAPGDLLFARSGATVGKTYMYRSSDGPCVYAGYLIRFRALPETVVPEFLELCTRSQSYRRWVASMFRAGAQPNINASEYSSLLVPLPPIVEQQTIVSVMNCMDETLERGRIETDMLNSLKASAADALLTGRVRVGV